MPQEHFIQQSNLNFLDTINNTILNLSIIK